VGRFAQQDVGRDDDVVGREPGGRGREDAVLELQAVDLVAFAEGGDGGADGRDGACAGDG